jgi:hypothetical protein
LVQDYEFSLLLRWYCIQTHTHAIYFRADVWRITTFLRVGSGYVLVGAILVDLVLGWVHLIPKTATCV